MTIKELVEKIDTIDLGPIFAENWCDLAYGPPGSSKTTTIALLALWLWRHKKLKTRWIVGDGGFQTVQNMGLVRAGAVEFCEYSHRPEPATTVELLCEGYWPGKALIQGTNFTKLEPTPKSEMDKIGLTVIEGFSVMSSYVMSNIQGGYAQRAALGEKMGVEAVSRVVDTLDVGGGKRTHATQTGWAPYNQAQTLLLGCKRRSENLGHVIWTTHERAAEDATNNDEKWIGPDVAGKALTTKIAGMFGNTWHFTTVQRKTQGEDPFSKAKIHKVETLRRVFTVPHFDPDGTVQRQYVANNRVHGLKESYDLTNIGSGLELWDDLATLKKEALEVLI